MASPAIIGAVTGAVASALSVICRVKQKLTKKIIAQENMIETLKSTNASSADIDQAETDLMLLKITYQKKVGEEYPSPCNVSEKN